MEINGVF